MSSGNTDLLSPWRSLRIKLHDWCLLFCRVSTMTIHMSIKECAVRLIMLCYVITHATNSAHAAYSWPLGITHARAHCSLSWGADRVHLLLLMAAEEPERGVQMFHSVHVKCWQSSMRKKACRPCVCVEPYGSLKASWRGAVMVVDV